MVIGTDVKKRKYKISARGLLLTKIYLYMSLCYKPEIIITLNLYNIMHVVKQHFYALLINI